MASVPKLQRAPTPPRPLTTPPRLAPVPRCRCYQVPPLVLGKPAVVISPLISLMEDQVGASLLLGSAVAFQPNELLLRPVHA